MAIVQPSKRPWSTHAAGAWSTSRHGDSRMQSSARTQCAGTGRDPLSVAGAAGALAEHAKLMSLTPWQLKHPLPGSSSTPPYLYVARHFVSVVAESTHVCTHCSELVACIGRQLHLADRHRAGKGASGGMDRLFCMADV